MPRPKKCRKVCQMPQIREFRPVGENPDEPAVVLTVDEYEAIRLIDKEGFSQEECSSYMQVARTTAPVSYTHLDVYKRQILWYSLSISAEFIPE